MANGTMRIGLVEQLRGLAALAVAWFHLTNGYHDWVGMSGSFGWLGVEVFFVISGFVIPFSLAHDWQLRGTRALPLFLARRLVRIEPPYLASVLLVVVLNLLAMRIPGFRGQIETYRVEQILLHAAYLIPLTGYNWLQPVYWTLAFEFGFYAVVAGLIGLLAGSARWPVPLILGGLLGGIVTHHISALLALFGMGCLVFRAKTGRDPTWLAFALAVICGLAMAMVGAVAEAVAGLVTTVLLITPSLATGATGWLGRMLGGLGTVSFSLYLLHIPVGGKIVNLGQRWLSGQGEHLALSMLALAVSLVAAAIFWRYVELPCVKAARSLVKSQAADGAAGQLQNGMKSPL